MQDNKMDTKTNDADIEQNVVTVARPHAVQSHLYIGVGCICHHYTASIISCKSDFILFWSNSKLDQQVQVSRNYLGWPKYGQFHTTASSGTWRMCTA